MITRLDDELHRRLKSLAAAEGRSLNDVVVETLSLAVGESSGRRSVRERARVSGLLVVPEQPAASPSPDALRAATVGTGNAVSEALEADRGGDR